MAQAKPDPGTASRPRHGPAARHTAPARRKASPALKHISGILFDGDEVPGPTDGPHGDLFEDASPLFITDPDGRLLYSNRAYRKLAAVLPPAAVHRTPDGKHETAVPRQELAVEIDGETKFFALEQHILRDREGLPLAVVGRLASIEESKRLRRALALSEERFNDIARLVSDWVWETNRDLALTYVSPRVTGALGYHPRELLGRRLEDLASGPIDPLTAADRTKAPFRGVEVRLRHRDGAVRSFKLSGLPVYCRESGEFLGFRGTAQDVTELLAHETALKEAVDAAEAANRTKSEFLANTSHELRTPLNAIIGFSEIMHMEEFGPIGSARYREYAGNVLESAQHLLTLINDILDVAKIEAGKLELDEAPVDSAELGRQALRLVTDRARRAGVALEARLPEGLPKLSVDGRKIKQILLNLLSNAIKFTPRAGRVELAAGRSEDGGFAFTVSDTGIGIAPEDQTTALTPFGQVDSQLARKFEGTGLGLPLSTALAGLHGGGLELKSTPGSGTTVTVRLPARRVISG